MRNIVIVGVDASPTAESAARAAAELAAGLGATLHVVSAYERTDGEVVGDGSDRFVMSAATDAEGISSDVAAQMRTIVDSVTSGTAQGRPADALIAEAVRLDARVIVVGNRHMQGLRRVLGSIPNSVAHNAPCDVFIVKTV